MDVDPPLLLFRAQYLQCLDPDFLTWPPASLLKQPDAQIFLYKRLFDNSKVPYRPSLSYEAKVLEMLVARIQRSMSGTAVVEIVSSHLYAYLNFTNDFLNTKPHKRSH